jgi:hypothetical protein
MVVMFSLLVVLLRFWCVAQTWAAAHGVCCFVYMFFVRGLGSCYRVMGGFESWALGG